MIERIYRAQSKFYQLRASFGVRAAPFCVGLRQRREKVKEPGDSGMDKIGRWKNSNYTASHHRSFLSPYLQGLLQYYVSSGMIDAEKRRGQSIPSESLQLGVCGGKGFAGDSGKAAMQIAAFLLTPY
jgi:hypothetical protein